MHSQVPFNTLLVQNASKMHVHHLLAKLSWYSYTNTQGVVTTNSPVEPSATGIKIKSSDQDVLRSGD